MMPSSWSKYSRRNTATRAASRRDAITRHRAAIVFARQRGNLVEK